MVSVNVLHGAVGEEEATLSQFLSGMEWAVTNKDDVACGGYEVLSISAETKPFFAEDANQVFDITFNYLHSCGLVPLVASGNGGPQGTPLGTCATYVGAVDSAGKPWPHNGHRCDLLAPGSICPCSSPLSLPWGTRPWGWPQAVHWRRQSWRANPVAPAVRLAPAPRPQVGAGVPRSLIMTARDKRINLDDAFDSLYRSRRLRDTGHRRGPLAPWVDLVCGPSRPIAGGPPSNRYTKESSLDRSVQKTLWFSLLAQKRIGV